MWERVYAKTRVRRRSLCGAGTLARFFCNAGSSGQECPLHTLLGVLPRSGVKENGMRGDPWDDTPHSKGGLQTSEEVQKILLLRTGQRVVAVNDRVGFGVADIARYFGFVDAIGGKHIEQFRVGNLLAVLVGGEEVSLDRLYQVAGASVMQEEEALTQAPERRRAKLVDAGPALVNTVGKARTHVVQG